MSHNQSRGERSEFAQYRKTARSGNSNQQRQLSGGASAKGGGGASFAPSNPSNRSYNKKYNSNAQGGQSGAKSPNVSSDSSNSSAPPIAVQNGAHQQQPAHRVSDAPVTSNSPSVQPTDNPAQRVTRAVPRAPSSNVSATTQQSNVSTAGAEPKAPTTPAKAPGDASNFPLQFGSISPGFMNGMQIPARTSSAPPNLDEQKKDQARNESSRAAPAAPIPSIPKQHSRKDAGISEQPNDGEAQPPPKSKRDTQLSASPPVSQTQKPSVYPIPGMHMQLPFHQMQVPVQFGGPNPQIQSQAMSGASLQMPIPIPLPIGNSPVQPPMFLSGLQPHPMQSQGMIHQGQSLSFSSQMGAQLPPQLGNMGMNMSPQFPQQQAGKYSGSRKTVKITHPETHEELRLDVSPGPRSRPNAPPQSQPIPSFPPNHPMNLYPNYFPPASSVPLSSAQVTSQPPRLYNQVIVKPAVGSHQEKELLAPTSSLSGGKTEALGPSSLHGKDSVYPQKGIQPSSMSSLPQSRPGLGTPSAVAASSGPVKVANDVPRTSDIASAPMDSVLVSSSSSKDTRSMLVVPNTTKDEHKKLGNSGQQLDQVGSQSLSLSSLPSQFQETEAMEIKYTSSGASLVSDSSKEPLSTTLTASSGASNITRKGDAEGKVGGASKSFGTKGVKIIPKEHEEATLDESVKPDTHSLETSLKSLSLSLESPEITVKREENSNQEVTASSAAGLLEETQQKLEESSGRDSKGTDNLVASTRTAGGNNESPMPATSSSANKDKISNSDVLSEPTNVVDQDSAPVLVLPAPEGSLKPENGDIYNNSGGTDSSSSSASLKDKVSSDASVAKIAAPRGKKKKKELYRKAEAAGTSSDLYNAYKGPDEKKETLTSSEGKENASTIIKEQTSTDLPQDNAIPSDKPDQSKGEPDDWEDAAEISTPQLETSNGENQGTDGDVNGLMTKRYSRDFLLKFLEQCTDLPEGFEVTSDIADALLVSGISVSRESYPIPGRNIDRPHSRDRRRGNGLEDEDKWSKFPGPLMSGRGDMRTDLGYAGNVGFRPVQGGNYGVLRNPRAQTPVQYVGGILYGPMQSLGPPGGLQRNNSESDRWNRGTGFQKGLMPYPQAPLPVIHRAEKKYEIGKVTDEEQAKQRQLKGILNKLTPQNFEKLFQQVKQVNIDNVVTLSGVISQIFDKALMEPTFCEMYANFCFHLAADLPDLSVDNERITFKRLLLNKCQEEFERGEREEEEAKKAEAEEGESKQTAEEREEKRLQTRRRMLGNIRLIGELYKKRMLTERIMHECINKLLGQYQNPDEENIEALCKLMSTIGEMIDHPKAKEHMDAYFNFMAQLSKNMKLSSRVRFMLKDAIDLRKNKWQQRRKVEGPKKIEEVHRDAAQERQAQASRLSRVPGMGGSIRRAPPMEYAPRAPSMLSSPTSQFGGYRAVPPQMRGHGSQDARIDERRSYENRTMSVPLPQRPMGDDSVTLGPQGGLARGMAFRGHPSASNIPSGEMPGPGDSRRMGPGPNGFNSMPERSAYNQRDDLMPRYMPDRFAAPYEQSHPQEQSITYGNREVRNTDRSFDRSLLTSPPSRGGPPTSMQNVSSEKVVSEEHLRDKSMATIKEFYSARDEKEVALCIKDLNSPAFHPSMISIWISDSFERKDTERDLLTKLLINLAKPRDGIISEHQLIKGFESVLGVLEDAVNDAPKAADYLGRIFAKVIVESIISLSEIGRLIYEGGEEQGQLVECGLAAEVLGSTLDIIKSEKGDSVLNEIRSSSNLRLENFRPPGSKKSLRIDKFIS